MPSTVRCPTCRQPVPWQGNSDRPFCSERCRLLDLGNWADESYRIPVATTDESDSSGSEDDSGEDG